MSDKMYLVWGWSQARDAVVAYSVFRVVGGMGCRFLAAWSKRCPLVLVAVICPAPM